MKYSAFIILISSFIFWLSGCSTSSVDQNFNPDEVITPGVIKKHVFFLASDSLMGRATPSRELDSAASYISREFSSSGVLPVKGSYFQKIKFGKISLASDNYLKIRFNGKEKSFTIKSEFTPFEMTADKEVSAPIVFAGYGITAPEYNYDDYKNIDVKGKVVFVLKHEPGENDTISLFDGAYPTKYSQVDTKVKIAREHGAVGMLVSTDPLNHTLLTPTGFPWPSLSKFIPKDALPVTIIENEEDKIPVVHAGQEVISELFGSVDSLRKLQKTIDQTFRGCSFELPEVNVSVKTSTEISGQPAYNVVGLIEGSDPKLKEEIVVVGAHYDHVGYKKNHESGTDYIFNGADDNASGTAAIIALSKAFAEMPVRPKRSILFIAFAGEEIGLMGSKFYTENPLLPLSNTVAMINLDMIGRNNPDSLCMIGSKRCPELAEIFRLENKKTGFIFDYTKEKFLPYSDQANFLKKKVPILFLTTDESKDYHKVSDHAELLDYQKASRVTKLAFYSILHIANDYAHYQILSSVISLF